MQVGDLVARTYGEGQRPMAIIIDLASHGSTHVMAKVLWCNGVLGQISARYLVTISRKNEKTS
jgi:hypothetical protein